MKKVFEYLAIFGTAAFVAFSCKPLPEDNSHVEEVVKAPAVNITVSDITDYSATITIAPAGAANYYAFVVDESDTDDTAQLDAASLYANKYSSVANGLVKYATSNSTTIDLDDLDPNTTYQIYAVAGSTTGVVGEIANASFLTTDAGTPKAGTPSKKENVLTVKFSEDVKYDESKPAEAIYYAYNLAVIGKDADGKSVVANTGAMGEAKVAVAVSGATATFTVTLDGTKPLPDGAYYTIAYPAGAFVDAVGNPCAAQKHVTGVTSDGTMGFGGAYGRVSTKEITLVPAKEKIDMITDLTVPVKFGFPEGTVVFKADKALKGKIAYENTDYNLSYSFTGADAFTYLAEEDSVAVYPHAETSKLAEPTRGDKVTINIPEKYITDIYGNTSSAVTIGAFLYSYGYKLEEVLGTYVNSGASAYGAKYNEDPWTFVLAKSDNAKKGNVMITEYYGFDELKQYGSFDVDKGELTFPIHYTAFYLGGYVDEGIYYDYCANSHYSTKKEPNITLNMTALGKFTSGNDLPGYIYKAYKMPESGNVEDIDEEADYLGYDYNVFRPIFSKVDETPKAAKTSLKSFWTPTRLSDRQHQFDRLLSR